MIKLTEDEKVILRNIDKKYRWVARNSKGDIVVGDTTPVKTNYFWTNVSFDLDKSNSMKDLSVFSHLFTFIQWEDEEPYLIEDLLKNNDIAATEIFDLKKVYDCFPQSFVNKERELIIYPRTNTYFLLKNVENQLQLDCKILEYCSGEAYDGAKKSKEYHFKGICDYFNKEFTQEEIRLIYMKLGNGINRELCIDYIKSCFDMEVLSK